MENLYSNILEPHIYKITNLLNQKIYIGKHDGTRKNYICSGSFISNSIKKNSHENFKKEIIVRGNFNKKLINELEKHFIQLNASNIKKLGYNLTKGGDGFSGKHKEETKIAISSKLKGIPKSEKTKIKFSQIHKGKYVSPETCEKISKSKMGQASWNKGKKGVQTAWNKGIPLTEEHRAMLAKNSGLRGKPAYNRKAILVYNSNGVFIEKIESISFALEKGYKALKKIRACCNGELNSHNGFIFKYES